MKKMGVKVLRGKKWQIEENLVLKEDKVYMPKDEALRMEIIQLYHNILVARHGEKSKTTELVIGNYWWLKVIRDVGKICGGL